MWRKVCFVLIFILLFQGIVISAEKTEKVSQLVPVCIHIMDLKEGPDGIPLSYPSFVSVDEATREIYVIDSGHGRIVVYTEDGYPLYILDKSRKIEAPTGVTIDQKGFLYICQSKTHARRQGRISILDPCFRWQRDIFFKGFEGAKDFIPRVVAIGKNGRFYVSGDGFKGVLVFDHNWNFLHILSPEDELLELQGKADICDVHVDDEGKIYLLSEGYGRVYIYDKNEKFLFKLAQKGGSSGKLSRPRSFAIEVKKHWIYVVDYMRHTVSVFGQKGEYLFEFGGKGWGPGWFQYPGYIYIDQEDRILVADTFNQRVQVLKVKLIKGTKEQQPIKTLRPGIPFKLKLKKE